MCVVLVTPNRWGAHKHPLLEMQEGGRCTAGMAGDDSQGESRNLPGTGRDTPSLEPAAVEGG